MAEFVEVIKHKKRMCKERACGLCEIGNGCMSGQHCNSYMMENPEKAEEIIMKWAEENSVKTNADKFKEVFGVDIFKDTIHNCAGIRRNANKCEECKYNGFWIKEYIEPKEDK